MPKKYAQWAGIAGTILLLVALLLFLYDNEITTRVLLLLGVALAGLTAWVLTSPEDLQNWISGKQAAAGTTSLIMLALFTTLAAVSYDQSDNLNLTWDFTCSAQYSLDTASIEVIDRVKEVGRPIRIVGFYPRQLLREREAADIILRQFDEQGEDMIEWQTIDPDESPPLAQTYRYGDVASSSPNAIFMSFIGETSEPDLPSVRYIGEANERAIANNLLQMITISGSKFYFTTGHAEFDYESVAGNGLSRSVNVLNLLNIVPAKINLLTEGNVPSDASALVIAAPSSPFDPQEIEAIRAYMENGGRLLILGNPPYIDNPFGGVNTGILKEDALSQYLWETFGFRFRDDMVIDQGSSFDSHFSPVPLINNTQEAVNDLPQDSTIIFALARSIEQNSEESRYLRENMLLSSQQSYSETNLQNLPTGILTEFNQSEDQPGPLVMGLAIRDSAEIVGENGSRLIAIGDIDWLTNDYITRSQGNALLWGSSVSWLAGSAETISIGATANRCNLPVFATEQQRQRISILTTLIMPATVLIIGGWVWFVRRRQ